MATRCSKHPFYYEPCSVCMEINKLEEDILDRNAKTIELEESLHCVVVEKLELEECLIIQDEKILKLEDLVKEQREEINDIRRVRIHAEESAKKYAEQTCELQSELDEALETIDQLLKDNVKPERMNPHIRNRLFVQDLNNVRGFLLSYTFLHNTIIQGKDRLKSLEGIELKQWTLFLNEIEEVYERWVDLKNLLINDISNSNWNRMIKEVQAITQKIVTQVNHRNLGHWTLSEEGTVDVEYQVRPLVIKAVDNCINSAGTNNLTAYSKELLVKELVKICEEK